MHCLRLAFALLTLSALAGDEPNPKTVDEISGTLAFQHMNPNWCQAGERVNDTDRIERAALRPVRG